MVSTKNSCGGCCCNSCEDHLPSDVRCCCNCVCANLCITLSFSGSSSCNSVVTEFTHDCVTHSWHGTMGCGGLSVDLDFSVKRCNDKCYVCLKSTCLGMAGDCPDDCIEITSPGRDFCRGKYTTERRDGGFETTWSNIDFSGCGGTTGSISIACTDRISRVCSSDCTPECDFFIVRTVPLIIDTCSCHCDCVCLSYQRDGDPGGDDCNGFSTIVCFDTSTKSWHADIECIVDGNEPGDPGNFTVEIDISIQTDVNGHCVLTLESDIGDIFPTDADELIEGKTEPLFTFRCPDFVASFFILHLDESESRFDIACLGCSGICGFAFAQCCDGIEIPGTLNVVITAEDPDGALTGSGIITYNPSSGCWEGLIDVVCNIDPADGGPIFGVISLKMCCDELGNWEMEAVCALGDTQGANPGLVCDPFSAVFGPFSSCKPGGLCGDYNVTVTE